MDYFHSPLSIYTLFQAKNLQGLGERIISIFEIKYTLFFLDLILIPVIRKLMNPGERNRRNFKRFIFCLLIGMIIVSIQPLKHYVRFSDPFKQYRGTDHIVRYSIIGYTILDLYSFVKENNVKLDDEEIRLIEDWFQEKSSWQTDQEDLFFGLGTNKNLIIIQVESLQSFVINSHIDGQEITPNINNMLDSSIYFPNIYPQTIEGNSSDAELLTQTSLYPLPKGSVFFRKPNNKYFSLGRLLNEDGYTTMAIHADEATYWNRDKIYPNLGFERYYSIEDFTIDEEIGMGLRDISMFTQSMEFLKSSEKPFYSFIITLTNHTPFNLPAEYRELKLDDELDRSKVGGYLQSVHYTDKAIGIFMDELKQSGLLEESIIVIYGDHDGLRDQDRPLIEKFLEKENICVNEWIQKYVPIPFIIYIPGINGVTFDTVGGQVDVFPTVKHIMGIEPDRFQYYLGKNLLLEESGYAIIPQGEYSTRQTYIVTQDDVDLFPDQKLLRELEISNLIISGDYFRFIDDDE